MAGHASATTCILSVSSNDLPVGQPFTFGVYITPGILHGPLPPPSFRPYSAVFYGTKNGVSDIPPGGETYPALFPNNYSTLTGYGNPGWCNCDYLHYPLIYANGQLVCVTNSVNVTLQSFFPAHGA
jgi:hypothetical protein